MSINPITQDPLITDIWITIFKKLDAIEDLLNVGSVCKFFKQAADRPELWAHVLKKRRIQILPHTPYKMQALRYFKDACIFFEKALGINVEDIKSVKERKLAIDDYLIDFYSAPELSELLNNCLRDPYSTIKQISSYLEFVRPNHYSLGSAIEGSFPSAVPLLLQAGAQPNSFDLDSAIQKGFSYLVTSFLEAGAKPSQKTIQIAELYAPNLVPLLSLIK